MIWHSIQEFRSSQLFHIQFDSHSIWFHIQFDFTFNLISHSIRLSIFNLTISHSIWFHIQFDSTFNLIPHSIWRFHIQIDIHFLERPSRPPRPFQWLRQHSLTSRCLSAASGQSGRLLVTRIICFSLSLFIYFIWYLPIHSVAQVIITWAANPKHPLRRASVPWPVKFQFRTWIVFHF